MRPAPFARVLLGTALLAFLAIEASARPGGGNSYSGGSSSRSSGSSGSGSSSRSSSGSSSRSSGSSSSSSSGSSSRDRDSGGSGSSSQTDFGGQFSLGFFLLGSGSVLVLAYGARRQQALDAGGGVYVPALPSQKRAQAVNLLRRHDPDFSLVLFEDFAYTLYAESQRARHDPRALLGLAPYWTKTEMDSLAARPPQGGRVQAVVMGALGPERSFDDGAQVRLEYSFETNLHIVFEGSPSKPVEPTGTVSSLLIKTGLVTRPVEEQRAITQYVQETWTFSRDAKVKTRSWSGVRKLGCPNCAAPLGTGGDARCQACGEVCGEGRFDWRVVSVTVNNVEEKPHSLTGTSEEIGTDAPTRFAPSVRHDIEALFRDDPGLNQASLDARLRLIFNTLQSAWTAQDLRPLRPFVSDRQHDYLQYWIEAYKQQGLQNLMARPRLDKFVFARVSRDTHYDALTLRVWASGCDYTIDTKTKRVVGGSRTAPRRYSEYWTLIRSARVRGTPRLDQNCPGCGVPLILNMAGECEHCSAHVTSGEFDWVLSKIEQDEAYGG